MRRSGQRRDMGMVLVADTPKRMATAATLLQLTLPPRPPRHPLSPIGASYRLRREWR